MIKNTLTKFSQHRWCIGIILSLAILTVIWFAVFPYRTFMGDDLGLIDNAKHGGYASSLVHALTDAPTNKYRPVHAAFVYLESLTFGTDFRSYMYLNIFLEFLNACLVSFICYRLSRKQLFVAFSCGVIFIISRFSYYNVLQVTGGALEGLALFFFLLLLSMTLYAYETKKLIFLTWALLFYILVIFTDERYAVVGGFLVIATLLAPIDFKPRWHKFVLATVPIVVLIFNYFVKTVIFQVNFFTGTGGQAIAFDYHQFFSFMFKGFSNMLGFNNGPNYLSGLNISRAGITGFAVGTIFLTSLATLILVYIYHRFRSTLKIYLSDYRNAFLFLALFVPLLASASITFRQEFRWLYAPYIVVIFCVSYLIGRISPTKWLRFLLIIFILASALSVDVFYRGYLNNVFFIDGLRVADSAKENIIDKYGSNLSQKELFFIGANSSTKSWYFMDDTFFRFYTGDREIHMHYVDTIEEIKNSQVDINNILVFSFNPNKSEITDITQKARAELDFLNKPSFDFLTNYKYGKISSTQRVGTPTGYGAFTMNWPSDLGNEKTLTINTTFSYAYDKVLIKDGDFLSFTAGIPLEGGDGARAYVDVVTANGERRRMIQVDLPPATKNGIKWESFLIPCGDYTGQEVTVTFGVESPSGNQNADWVAFGNPLLLSHR